MKQHMTKDTAEFLARDYGDDEFVAKKIHGNWVVWCLVSDHVVEFEDDQIIRAALACVRF